MVHDCINNSGQLGWIECRCMVMENTAWFMCMYLDILGTEKPKFELKRAQLASRRIVAMDISSHLNWVTYHHLPAHANHRTRNKYE